MKKNNNQNEPLRNYYNELKEKVKLKIELEETNMNNSNDYIQLLEDIKKIALSIPYHRLDVIKYFLRQESDTLINFNNSDIESEVSKYIMKKLTINYACSDIIDKLIEKNKKTTKVR